MRVQCDILSKINPVPFVCSKLHSLFRQHPGRAAHCFHFAQATDIFRFYLSFSLSFSIVSENTHAICHLFKSVGIFYLFGGLPVEKWTNVLSGKAFSSVQLCQDKQQQLSQSISIRKLHLITINNHLFCSLEVDRYSRHERSTTCITNNNRRMSMVTRTFAGSFLLSKLQV